MLLPTLLEVLPTSHLSQPVRWCPPNKLAYDIHCVQCVIFRERPRRLAMRNDAPILHRSHSTPAPTLHKRASSGTGAQIVPLMPSRGKSEKPADEDDILDYSVWEKEVEALSARVQRLASISRCPELVAVARQHSRKAEQVQVVRTAEPVMVRRRFWRFFHPRRELEDYPDAEQKKEKKLLEKQVQKQKKEAARAEKKKKELAQKQEKKKAIVRIGAPLIVSIGLGAPLSISYP